MLAESPYQYLVSTRETPGFNQGNKIVTISAGKMGVDPSFLISVTRLMIIYKTIKMTEDNYAEAIR